MRPPLPRRTIDGLLRAGGWFPGRDETAEADRLVRWRVEDSARQGFPLRPSDRAIRFLRSFAPLEFPLPLAPERRFVANPAVGYEGDAERIADLAEYLGRDLFPVGYETVENGLVLADGLGRFFYLHHTGPSFLGAGETRALSSLMTGDQAPVEDHQDHRAPEAFDTPAGGGAS
ncbi:SUKH-3 domain-containing protein [Streptomyces megasporus]|uniref:SUKH-3 domain-containing protein n=1 Tax=Streptomyces megasporus TaxID=44060 RepID=UPI00068B2A32|nr:SUKH-3 domain-containing protein [Streptomyces megasporus]